MLALWQAVYTTVHKTLAGRLPSLGLSRSPPQDRDHPSGVFSDPQLHQGQGTGPLGERRNRRPQPQHWGQRLNRVKGWLLLHHPHPQKEAEKGP